MSTNVANLNPHKKQLILDSLYACAETFNDQKSATDFIDQLLTESEKVTIGRRIVIAQMILAGCPQTEVRATLGVSPNTFARTRSWLNGEIANYADALSEHRITTAKKDSKRKKTGKKFDPLTFKMMRKKFPMHFLFFNLAEEILIKINK